MLGAWTRSPWASRAGSRLPPLVRADAAGVPRVPRARVGGAVGAARARLAAAALLLQRRGAAGRRERHGRDRGRGAGERDGCIAWGLLRARSRKLPGGPLRRAGAKGTTRGRPLAERWDTRAKRGGEGTGSTGGRAIGGGRPLGRRARAAPGRGGPLAGRSRRDGARGRPPGGGGGGEQRSPPPG